MPDHKRTHRPSNQKFSVPLYKPFDEEFYVDVKNAIKSKRKLLNQKLWSPEVTSVFDLSCLLRVYLYLVANRLTNELQTKVVCDNGVGRL